jgi:hypothetical protein
MWREGAGEGEAENNLGVCVFVTNKQIYKKKMR